MDDLQVIQNMPEGTVMFYSRIGTMTGQTKKKAATIQFLIDDDKAQSLMRSILANERTNEAEYFAFCIIAKNKDFDITKQILINK